MHDLTRAKCGARGVVKSSVGVVTEAIEEDSQETQQPAAPQRPPHCGPRGVRRVEREFMEVPRYRIAPKRCWCCGGAGHLARHCEEDRSRRREDDLFQRYEPALPSGWVGVNPKSEGRVRDGHSGPNSNFELEQKLVERHEKWIQSFGDDRPSLDDTWKEILVDNRTSPNTNPDRSELRLEKNTVGPEEKYDEHGYFAECGLDWGHPVQTEDPKKIWDLQARKWVPLPELVESKISEAVVQNQESPNNILETPPTEIPVTESTGDWVVYRRHWEWTEEELSIPAGLTVGPWGGGTGKIPLPATEVAIWAGLEFGRGCGSQLRRFFSPSMFCPEFVAHLENVRGHGNVKKFVGNQPVFTIKSGQI